MNETVTPIDPPPTLEIVALRVAEEIMAETFRRIAELEQRLQSILAEADRAERAAGTGGDAAPQLLEVAERLFRQADGLRRATAATTSASPAASGAMVLHLPQGGGADEDHHEHG